MKKEKDYNLSMIRFIALMMVIFCHIFEVIGFAYGYSKKVGIFGNFLAVGVDLFLMLSGYLYGCKKDTFQSGKERIQFILKNWKKVLIDYYIYAILIILPVYYFMRPDMFTRWTIFDVLTFSGTIGGVHHLWYIPYILFCYLLTPFLYDLKQFIKNKSQNSDLKYIFYTLTFMVVFQILGFAFDCYFHIVRINCFIMGFTIFPLLKEKMKNNATTKRKVLVTCLESVILLLSIGAWYYLRYKVTSTIIDDDLKTLVTGTYDYFCLIQSLALFYFYSLIGKALSKLKIVRKVLDFSDYFSYDIYICHMIFINGILSVLRLTPHYIPNIIIALVLSFISGIILKYLSNCVNQKRIILRRAHS